MIITFTSKRGGTGKTTLAMCLSYLLADNAKKSVCVVDLTINNDIKKFLRLNPKYTATIDKLICVPGLEDNQQLISQNLVNTGKFYVMPGTKTVDSNYLLNKVESILKVVISLEESRKFDYILLDVDGDIYKEMYDNGFYFDWKTFHILTQNKCNIQSYNRYNEVYDDFEEDSEERDINGKIIRRNEYVVNLYDSNISPRYEKIKSVLFPNLIKVDYDANLPDILNREKCNSITSLDSPASDGLKDILNNILGKQSKRSKKGGFFAKLFGR